MSEVCKKCSKGVMVFYDGAHLHNPKSVCNWCGHIKRYR